jgi:hypothetical protein
MSNDLFLNFLTARGFVRMQALREVMSQLTPRGDGQHEDSLGAYKLVRGMDMLGHAEYDNRSRPARLMVANPCLARTPNVERCQYLLCGARSTCSVASIKETAAAQAVRISVAVSKQASDAKLMPDKIILSFDDEPAARRIAGALRLNIGAAPAAWSLACLANSASDFESSLDWRPRTIVHTQLRFYNAAKMIFEDSFGEEQSGLAHTLTNPPSFYFVEKEREARVDDLDYARYWCQSREGVAGIQYDSKRHLLAVPLRLPLPRLFARALCLCSGEMPLQVPGNMLRSRRDSLLFRDVHAEIAAKISEKLEIHFIPQPITHIQGQ